MFFRTQRLSKVIFVVLCMMMTFSTVMAFKHGTFSVDNLLPDSAKEQRFLLVTALHTLTVIKKLSSIAIISVFACAIFFHRRYLKYSDGFSIPKARLYSYIYFFVLLFAITFEFLIFTITMLVFLEATPCSGENFWRSNLMFRFCGVLFLLVFLASERRYIQSYAANNGFCYRLMSLLLGGTTLLHHAVPRNNIAEIRSLLSKGHKIDVKDRRGQTPLHYAIAEGYTPIVKFLIGKKANVNALDKNGGTPLHYAAIDGRSEIAELLISNGADARIREKEYNHTPLHYACMEGHDTTAMILISKTGNIDTKDDQGGTPLHMSAFRGHVSLTKLLLENGADVNAMGNQDMTPLHLSASMGHVSLTKILLENGADVNTMDNQGMTPLHLSVRMGHEEVAQLILSYGAQEN